ncbi:hypothetical protein NXX23_17330 [Bacteroides ovatus]|nr:hypothetical protein [Bacteroides ovatus]MCS2761353.1 hypothetical protein [Bacteroides ovatus]
MDIKELTERYRDRFDAHYLQDDNGTGRKGRKRKKEVETPNFLKDVIRYDPGHFAGLVAGVRVHQNYG